MENVDKKRRINAYKNPIWLISGCKENDHKVFVRGETNDPEKAHNWFYSPYRPSIN